MILLNRYSSLTGVLPSYQAPSLLTADTALHCDGIVFYYSASKPVNELSLITRANLATSCQILTQTEGLSFDEFDVLMYSSEWWSGFL